MDKTVPPGAAKLLYFIGSIEAPKGYDTVYGNNQGKLTKPITKMTVDELIGHQAGFTKAFGSSASGRYQFMKATLQGLKSELGLRGTQVMDHDLQDRLGYHLLRRRGYDDFIAGRLTVPQFALNLAKEWASFPVLVETKGAHRTVKRGQSYYAGDGMNKALVAPERVEAVLLEVLSPPKTAPAPGPAPTPQQPTPAPPASSGGLLAMLPAILAAVLPTIIKEVVTRVAKDPTVPLDAPQPTVAAQEVATQVIERVQQIPEVQHATNTEPWYQSRVMIGAWVSMIAGVAGALGFVLSPDDIELIVGAIVAIGSVVGGLTTLYGRWKAKRPLGA
jgi:muramidase (phage lysozyme)